MGGFSSITGDETIMNADNCSFDGTARGGKMTTNGQLWIGSTASPHVRTSSLTAGGGINITNGPGTITIATTSGADLHTARFIVSANGAADGANYTTIAAAIAAAQGTGINQTVFIQPGTYTENLTLVPGINLTAYNCDALTPNVIINGKCTLTTAGTVSISGIRLQTNSDFALAITGSAASIVLLQNCFINASNNTAISFTSSSGSSEIRIYSCLGDVGTTGISYFDHSAAGNLRMFYCDMTNSGASTTASTMSGTGNTLFYYCHFNTAFSTSGTTAGFNFNFCYINTAAINTTCITQNSTNAGSNCNDCQLFSGTASAVSIGAGATLVLDRVSVQSSNTNAITGSGTLVYGIIIYVGTSSTNNVTTQTQFNFQPFGQLLTFTPALTFGGGNTGITYSTQSGFYYQVNQCVYYGFNITLSSKGSSTGVCVVTGFPVAAGPAASVSARPGISQINAFTFSANKAGLYLRFTNGSTSPQLFQSDTNSSGVVQADDTNFSNSTTIAGNGFYFIN